MLLAIFLFSLLLVLNPFFFSYLGGGRGVGVDCGMIGFLLAVEIPLQYKTFKGYFICYSTRCRLDSYLSQFNQFIGCLQSIVVSGTQVLLHSEVIFWMMQIAEDYSHCEFLIRLPGYCPSTHFNTLIQKFSFFVLFPF